MRATVVAVTLLLVSAVAAARQPAEVLAPPRSEVEALSDDCAYAEGYRVGNQIVADLAEVGFDVDRDALARGLADAVKGVKPPLDGDRMAAARVEFQAAIERRQKMFAERMREAARANLAKGREFLAANAKRPGVVSRPSGLQYEVVKEGAGAAPGPDDVVGAHYRGTKIDGSEFDATDPAGEPATFPLGAVVPGWREALPLMKAGSKWKLWLPPELAYGAEGAPPAIGPNEVLVFEIELVRSQPATGRP